MSGWQRLAGVWGALFPVAALILFAVFTGFGGRGTGADTAPGQTSGASQTTAQSGGTTSGGGSGGAMNSSAGGTAMTGSTQTTTTSTPSTTASGSATTSGSAATATQGAAAQATGSASASTGTTATGSTATNSVATGGTAATTATTPGSTTAQSGSTASSPQGATPAAAQSTPEGAQVYSTNCQSCHGPAGAGVAGAFPPLAGNKAILGSEKYVSDVLLYGLQGQIAVNGQTYNGVMPAWAATLSDAQIAAVLDHVRSSWGNSASAVSEATVKTERATPLTTAQVLAERPQ